MKAVAYDRYGRPDVLTVEDVPMPSPGPGQVLVKVIATSVNLSDWECLLGKPMYGGSGSPTPGPPGARLRHRRRVEAVGSDVTRFQSRR